jgi:hypothetical protein
MIIYRVRYQPECLTVTAVTGFECRPDMLVVSVKSLTDYSLRFSCTAATTGLFEGYVVDQNPLPVFWLDDDQVINFPPIIWPPIYYTTEELQAVGMRKG